MLKIVPNLIICFILCFTYNGNGQAKGRYTVPEAEIYDFMQDYSISINCFLWSKSNFKGDVGDTSIIFNDSFFSNLYVESFRKQILERKEIIWKPTKLPGVKLCDASLLEKIKKKGKPYCTIGVSIPLFNVAGNICVVRVGWASIIAGQSCINVYRKENGRWHLIKDYGCVTMD